MARRRRSDEPELNGVSNTGTAVADPPVQEQSNGEPAAPATAPKNRPVANFAASSDRTTRLEVAVWAWKVKTSDGEEFTQYSLSIARSWRDKEGQWTGNGFYRAHDVPVLLYLVQQAYTWCVAQRTQVRFGQDEELPF
jgi:hypothetical protein